MIGVSSPPRSSPSTKKKRRRNHHHPTEPNSSSTSSLVFVQHYIDQDDGKSTLSCQFVERTTGTIYKPFELPAGSPVWLEYYDKEHDCNYYQHSVTKEKVWTVEEIDAAEEESKHSVSVSFSREMKSSSSSPSPSPKRRDSTSRLLPTTKGRSSASSSPRSARSSPRSSSKKKRAAGSPGENRENQQTRNTPSSVVSDDNDNEGDVGRGTLDDLTAPAGVLFICVRSERR